MVARQPLASTERDGAQTHHAVAGVHQGHAGVLDEVAGVTVSTPRSTMGAKATRARSPVEVWCGGQDHVLAAVPIEQVSAEDVRDLEPDQ
jgi:hypothetical protein